MSLLGKHINKATGMSRKTVEHVEGDMHIAENRVAKFRNAYIKYLIHVERFAPGPTAHATYAFDNGDIMHIQSQDGTDYVTIRVNDKSEEKPVLLEGFLITKMKRDRNMELTNEPDLESQLLYRFRFALSGFANCKVAKKFAGNIRRRGDFGMYFSWDGTGGGDIAPEVENALENSGDLEAPAIRNPNIASHPFTAMSGEIYHDGGAYPVLNGKIFGMRVYGNRILLADFPNTSTVRIHEAKVIVTDGKVNKIEYIRVIGTATVESVGVVNFSKYLSFNKRHTTFSTECAVLGEVVVLAGISLLPDAPAVLLTTRKLTVSPDAEIVRSGFKDAAPREDGAKYDTLHVTLKRTTKTGAMRNFSPHSAYEYGLPDSEYGPISTSGHVVYAFDYFELDNTTNIGQGKSPAWIGVYDRSNFSSIIKSPKIVFQGMYPITVYEWLRTISITNISSTNELYWYLDYDTGSYVRLNWAVGYSATTNYETYGIPEPIISSLLVSKALNVGGNVVENGSSTKNWFYVVTNDLGDYVLRTAPNGELSDALLVAKNGITRIVKETYSVGII